MKSSNPIANRSGGRFQGCRCESKGSRPWLARSKKNPENRNGHYHARLVVPKDLRAIVGKRITQPLEVGIAGRRSSSCAVPWRGFNTRSALPDRRLAKYVERRILERKPKRAEAEIAAQAEVVQPHCRARISLRRRTAPQGPQPGWLFCGAATGRVIKIGPDRVTSAIEQASAR
ncbi:MAG: hypothetical protein ACQEUH_10810 [Pseudomonadota bacterium]